MVAAILLLLAVLSGVLMAWQWWAAVRFPLNQRRGTSATTTAAPSVTVLKALKGAGDGVPEALTTWLRQEYPGEWEIVFAVDAADDPAVPVVERLMAEHPRVRARVVVCPERLGFNRKVSNLIQAERAATGQVIALSDADVAVSPDMLVQMVAWLRDDPKVGLVHCLYRFADAPTPAARWEALAVNADFWSQVLQNRMLAPLDYALGAAVMLRREDLAGIGGFEALRDYLADDNRLGRLVVARGQRTELCPVVVDCRAGPGTWAEVWRHQLRWAVTIRVCQGLPYFFSILANGTLWPLVWVAWARSGLAAAGAAGLVLFRIVQALSLEARLVGRKPDWARGWLVPVKDLLQVGLWAGAFLGREVVWGGVRYRVLRDGRLTAAE